MKTYILLIVTLLLAACATTNDDELTNEFKAKILSGKLNYKITHNYYDNNTQLASSEFIYRVSDQGFHVNTMIKQDSDVIISSYIALRENNQIKELKSIDQSGDKYSITAENYADIMQNYILPDMSVIDNLSLDTNTNVTRSQTENFFVYTVINGDQIDTYKLSQDGLKFLSEAKKETNHILTKFELLP